MPVPAIATPAPSSLTGSLTPAEQSAVTAASGPTGDITQNQGPGGSGGQLQTAEAAGSAATAGNPPPASALASLGPAPPGTQWVWAEEANGTYYPTQVRV